jgi:hypothetical protein
MAESDPRILVSCTDINPGYAYRKCQRISRVEETHQSTTTPLIQPARSVLKQYGALGLRRSSHCNYAHETDKNYGTSQRRGRPKGTSHKAVSSSDDGEVLSGQTWP